MSVESRIRQLETIVAPECDPHSQVIIYQPGELPERPEEDGRVRIFIPDNGRGPNETAQ